jgi:serralysin
MRTRPGPVSSGPVTIACLMAAALIGSGGGPADAAGPGSGSGSALPAVSSGSTISADDGAHSITYAAGSGQANDPAVSVSTPAGTDQWIYTVHDVAAITPGTGCSRPAPADPSTVACVLHEFGDFYVTLQFYLGDGVDRIDFAAADAAPRGLGGYAVIHGGPGNDVLVSSGAEYLWGDDGNDTISGSDNRKRGNRLLGGPGNDTIRGGAGPDLIYGNSGQDRIVGGTGNDQLFGGPGADVIYGNSGNDHIEGGASKDFLSGGPDSDFVKQ